MLLVNTTTAPTTTAPVFWLVYRDSRGVERSNGWYDEDRRERFIVAAGVAVVAKGTR